MKDWVRKLLGKDLFDAVSSLENPRHAFRTLLLTMVIAVLDLVMLGFALLHYFYTQDMPLAIASIVAALVLSVAFLYLRTTQNISNTGHFTSAAIVIFLPIYAHLNQNDQFGLFWLFVVPFLAVAFNGYKIGLAYILVYSVVIMSEAHLNIGVWEAGNWTHLSTLRLLVGLLVFTALATVLDVANEHLNRRIENQRRKEDVYLSKLKKLSTIDGLTSLYNRRHFNDVLNLKIKELKDSDLYLTFFILDIDHFKHYNDHYGHQKGDQALQRVAAVVRQFMKRHHDLVFRMGGEEFAGILVSDTPNETSEWLAQLTHEVERLKIPHSPVVKEPFLTISIGIFSAQVNDLSCINTIYKTADKALYQAKFQGRNQAVIVKPLPRS